MKKAPAKAPAKAAPSTADSQLRHAKSLLRLWSEMFSQVTRDDNAIHENIVHLYTKYCDTRTALLVASDSSIRRTKRDALVATLASLDALSVRSKRHWENFNFNLSTALVPTLEDFKATFHDLTDEFGEYTFSRGVITVTTEPIVIQNIQFGRFKLRLLLGGVSGLVLGQRSIGSVLTLTPLEPNRPNGPGSHCHPHVSGSNLCVGEANTSMTKALIDGRIADFFILARSVLRTYSSSSPYCSIEAWTTPPCCNCGGRNYDDGPSGCAVEGCKNGSCLDCIVTCDACSGEYCHKHSMTCVGCLCVSICAGCAKRRKCPDCIENEEETPVRSRSTAKTGFA